MRTSRGSGFTVYLHSGETNIWPASWENAGQNFRGLTNFGDGSLIQAMGAAAVLASWLYVLGLARTLAAMTLATAGLIAGGVAGYDIAHDWSYVVTTFDRGVFEFRPSAAEYTVSAEVTWALWATVIGSLVMATAGFALLFPPRGQPDRQWLRTVALTISRQWRD